MKGTLALIFIIIGLNSFSQEIVDTVVFDNGYCYHDAMSCHTFFITTDGEESIHLENAYLKEFEDSEYNASIKKEYANRVFVITYMLITIQAEDSINGELYETYDLISIRLL
jgi:hypothetical protein